MANGRVLGKCYGSTPTLYGRLVIVVMAPLCKRGEISSTLIPTSIPPKAGRAIDGAQLGLTRHGETCDFMFSVNLLCIQVGGRLEVSLMQENFLFASVVQWYNASLPSWKRGFDSH